MPRDGLQQYAPPAGTQGIPNYTVESARYNTFVADVSADQNNPRPIVAGGTSAVNAIDARKNLGADVGSLSQAVTNYDMQIWESGSFSSFAGAIGAPEATQHYTGTANILTPDGAYITLRVISVTTGAVYTRIKNGGVWSPWVSDVTANDARYVNISGDTMSGPLTLGAVNPVLTFNKPSAANNVQINSSVNNVARWTMLYGDSAAETGGNLGTNFQLWGYNDAGNALTAQLSIDRNTGILRTNSGAIFGGDVGAGGVGGDIGSYYFGNTGTRYLNWNGTSFTLAGGPLNVAHGGGIVTAGPVNATGGFSASTSASYSPQINLFNSANDGGAPYVIMTKNRAGGGVIVGDGLGTLMMGGKASNNADVNAVQFSASVSGVGAGYIEGAASILCGNNSGVMTTAVQCSAYKVTIVPTTGSSSPSTGALVVNGGVGIGGALWIGGTMSGQDLALRTGGLFMSGWGGTAATAAIFMNSTNTAYLYHDASGFSFTGGSLTVGDPNGVYVTGYGGSGAPWLVNCVRCNPNHSSFILQGLHYSGQWAGFSMDLGGAASFSFRSDASAWKSGGSTAWGIGSDARIKNVLGDYTNGLDAIAALRPVRYTYKGNDTHAPPSSVRDGEEKPEGSKEAVVVPYANSINYGPAADQIEYIGLVAQEAEVTVPETITKHKGYIDGVEVDDLRGIDHTPLIFALINAVKELKAEVDALKARR
jgi:hypothetical protein